MKRFRPTTKVIAAIIRKTKGAFSSQSLTTEGVFSGSNLQEDVSDGEAKIYNNRSYIVDFLQVKPRRLLIPDETLKTSDMNQKRFTNPP